MLLTDSIQPTNRPRKNQATQATRTSALPRAPRVFEHSNQGGWAFAIEVS
jgi:hypothetical protein